MLLLVDLDGVVYRGANPVPGVAAVLAARAATGDEVVYVTNNSMFYRSDYVSRLSAMGAPVTADRVVSSARASALYLRDLEPPVARVLALGCAGLRREIADVGIEVVDAGEAGNRWLANGRDPVAAVGHVDAVVVGLDPELTYARLAVAGETVRAGVRFVATNRDPVYPLEHGFQPGSGAVVAAVEAAAGRSPVVSLGKPAPLLLEIAARAVHRRPSEAVMIGDSMTTDMPAARAVGARSVLMLTGVTSAAQLDLVPPDQRPTEVARDAGELAAALDRLAASAPTAA